MNSIETDNDVEDNIKRFLEYLVIFPLTDQHHE